MFVSPHISKRDNDLTSDKSKQPINQSMTKNLNSCIFVRSIPAESTEEDVRKVFQPFGSIISIKLKKKVSPFSPSRFQHSCILYESVQSC